MRQWYEHLQAHSVPGARVHWLLGTLPEWPPFGDEIIAFNQKRRKQFGPVHTISLLWMQQVNLYSPEALKSVLSSNTHLRKRTADDLCPL